MEKKPKNGDEAQTTTKESIAMQETGNVDNPQSKEEGKPHQCQSKSEKKKNSNSNSKPIVAKPKAKTEDHFKPYCYKSNVKISNLKIYMNIEPLDH